MASRNLLRKGDCIKERLKVYFLCFFICLLFRGWALFRDIDSVKELTQILMADTGCLLNLSSSQRNIGNIGSRKLDLILNIGGTDVFDSWKKLDLTDTTFTQKVSDLNILARKTDVDGEMGINESHLVKESTGDTDDHVLDVRADSTDTGELLTVSKPQVNLDELFLGVILGFSFNLGSGDNTAVHANVLEVTLEATKLSSDLDLTGLDLNLDCTQKEAFCQKIVSQQKLKWKITEHYRGTYLHQG